MPPIDNAAGPLYDIIAVNSYICLLNYNQLLHSIASSILVPLYHFRSVLLGERREDIIDSVRVELEALKNAGVFRAISLPDRLRFHQFCTS